VLPAPLLSQALLRAKSLPVRITFPDTALILERMRRLTSASAALSAGFDACAKHGRSPHIVDSARALTQEHRSLVSAIACLSILVGAHARPAAATCERLRWEWLASTATLLDGTPDARLVTECARLVHLACEIATALHRDLIVSGSNEASSVASVLERLESTRNVVMDMETACAERSRT